MESRIVAAVGRTMSKGRRDYLRLFEKVMSARGPKPGRSERPSSKNAIWYFANQVLTSPDAPEIIKERKHGWKKTLAQMVHQQLKADGLPNALSGVERELGRYKLR